MTQQIETGTQEPFAPSPAGAPLRPAPGRPARGAVIAVSAPVSVSEKSTGDAGGGAAGVKPLGFRAPEFIKRSRMLHLCWQAGVLLAGLAVVIVGVILLPLHGPGWVVIFAGMALWVTEFVWAQLVLRWTRRKLAEAAQRALDPRVRRRNIALTTAGAAVCGALSEPLPCVMQVTVPRVGFSVT